jgi:hypothetical protein
MWPESSITPEFCSRSLVASSPIHAEVAQSVAGASEVRRFSTRPSNRQ